MFQHGALRNESKTVLNRSGKWQLGCNKMMSRASAFDGYSYYINEDSDEEILQNSSDEECLDEVDVFLHGTKEQQRKALKSLTGDCIGDEASSSDDDFEKIMQNELEAKVKDLTNSWKKSDKVQELESGDATASTSRPSYYDDVYFDSDDEQNKSSNSKKRIMTDDELLYDPSADEEDQKWVDRQKNRSLLMKPGSSDGKTKKQPMKSKKRQHGDAVLNCPACMTTLCVDCQRHSIYENQYRAMFVMNCEVNIDEALHYKPRKKKEFKRHKKRNQNESMEESQLSSMSFETATPQTSTESETNLYHPVKCAKCTTEVAVYDSDEVYHFFNIISSCA